MNNRERHETKETWEEWVARMRVIVDAIWTKHPPKKSVREAS